MSGRAVLAVSALLTIMVSCGGTRTFRELRCIEDVLKDSSDSAAVMLEKFDTMAMNERCTALYAILRTQTDFKREIQITSDSLILKAVDFYGGRRDRYHKAMAWYSLGCVYSEFNSTPADADMSIVNDAAATEAFLKAKDLFPDSTDLYYAICQYQLGVNYTRKEMFDEALNFFRDCRSNFERNGRMDNVSLTDYSIAAVLMLDKRYDESYRLFRSLMENPNLSTDRRETCWLQLAKIAAYGYGEIDSALVYVDRYIESFKDRKPAAGYALKGRIYMVYNQNDSAFSYLSKSVASTRDINTLCLNYRSLAELAVIMRNYQASVNFSRMYETLLDSVYTVRSQNELTRVRIRHMEEVQQQRQHDLKVKALLAGLVLFAVVIAVFIFVYIQMDRRNKQYYIRMHDEFLVRQAHERRKEGGDLLESCCSGFREGTAYSLIMKLASQQRFFKVEERELVNHDVGVYFSDIQRQLRDEAPNISANEFLYLILKAVGLDSKVIANIMCTSLTNLRSIKLRVRRKLTDETASRFLEGQKGYGNESVGD
ncbi:MAG: hypothetical protein J5732_01945 [Bacteroidaceae bacterium]|nr:hypothetical protein [Bacteroidaceae bacterium]